MRKAPAGEFKDLLRPTSHVCTYFMQHPTVGLAQPRPLLPTLPFCLVWFCRKHYRRGQRSSRATPGLPFAAPADGDYSCELCVCALCVIPTPPSTQGPVFRVARRLIDLAGPFLGHTATLCTPHCPYARHTRLTTDRPPFGRKGCRAASPRGAYCHPAPVGGAHLPPPLHRPGLV
jgi:hypothetical protein